MGVRRVRRPQKFGTRRQFNHLIHGGQSTLSLATIGRGKITVECLLIKKIILAATAPVVLAACVEKLVEDNEDRAAQIQIGTAVAGLVLTGIGTIAALANPVVYH